MLMIPGRDGERNYLWLLIFLFLFLSQWERNAIGSTVILRHLICFFRCLCSAVQVVMHEPALPVLSNELGCMTRGLARVIMPSCHHAMHVRAASTSDIPVWMQCRSCHANHVMLHARHAPCDHMMMGDGRWEMRGGNQSSCRQDLRNM
jgi:hypothetical protein